MIRSNLGLFACSLTAMLTFGAGVAHAQPAPAQATRGPGERTETARATPATAVGPAHETIPQPVGDPGGDPVTAQTPLRTGEAVAVEWHGNWYSGHVVSLGGANVRIHYDGYDASQDETVPRTRLRIHSPAFAPRPPAIAPTGTPLTGSTLVTPGEAVQVIYAGHWWAGHVRATLADGQVVIGYDGWPASSDEIVARERLLIAPPGASTPEVAQSSSTPPGRAVTAQTPLAPGDPVHIEWQATYYPGRVVALLSTGGVRVHYLGWGNASDESVPRERLRIGVARPEMVRVPGGTPTPITP